MFLAAILCVCKQIIKEFLHNGLSSHISYANGSDVEDLEHEMYAHGNTSKSVCVTGILDRPADLHIEETIVPPTCMIDRQTIGVRLVDSMS
jgi:hypothetical protein